MFVNELHQGGISALLDWDNTIFDDMNLPDGITVKEVVDRIIFKYGDTPLMHPEPDVMKYYIPVWSARRLTAWNRYKNAIEIDYDPLNNYDRTEEGETTAEQKISADNASDYQPDSLGNAKSKLRAYGNIGVTTSQQMLASELDIVTRLDLIEYIADDFRNEFCLNIY